MQRKWLSHTRAVLFLGIVAAVGTANAGALEVSHVTPSASAAGNNGLVFVVANRSATQVSDVQVYLNGQDATATCTGATSAGSTFALADGLGAGDNVVCSGASSGGSTSITVAGTDANGAPLVHTVNAAQLTAAAPDKAIVGIAPSFVFNDESNTDGLFDAGETVSLTYTVINFGNVGLSNIAVSDSLGSTVSCPQTTLAVGGATVCSATHTITAAEDGLPNLSANFDVFADGPGGQSTNDGLSFILFPNNSNQLFALNSPRLADDVDGNGVAGPGDLVEYTFSVTVSSSRDVNDLTMAMTVPASIDTPITCNGTTVDGAAFTGLPPSGDGFLAAGDTILCSADYTITQADADSADRKLISTVNATAQPLTAGGADVGPRSSGNGAGNFPIPTAPVVAVNAVPTPVNDWRALLLLGLGLVMVMVVSTRRKFHKR